MKGVSAGPEVGPGGNYGTLICAACEKVEFVVLFIRDAALTIAICSGCGEIASAAKVDQSRSKEEVDREITVSANEKDATFDLGQEITFAISLP